MSDAPSEPLPSPFTYPMDYTFRILAYSKPDLPERLRQLVESIVGPVPREAVKERPSAQGNYLSIHVRCMLDSEEQRRDVYLRLRTEAAVVMTL